MGISTAGAISLASVGFQAGGAVLKGFGQSTADTFQAEEATRKAEYAGLEASQKNAQMTRNLGITLGNIDAIRAAAHTNPTSPTGAAVRDYTEQVGTEQKNITVDSILAQQQQDEASAAYLRKASSVALLSGSIDAGAGILGKNGIAGLPALQGGLGNSSIGNPTQIGALY
jgi:hypothetical protein